MLSLLFGVVAALSWGVHDVCVRFATARTGVTWALLTVLAAGLLIVAPIAALWGDWAAVESPTVFAAGASGLAYAAGSFGLYHAFAIGPVRLVAPVIGAYPILSLLWAAARGQPPSSGQVLAVLAIVAGVALTALMAGRDTAAKPGSNRAALRWSVVAACGFALTFAFGQIATADGAALPAVLISRAVAFLTLLTASLALGLRPNWTGVPWGLLLVMGCCDALALGLVIAAGGLAHPEFASVTASTFGMVTVLLAWAFLQERISTRQWFAVALVFAGIGYLAA